MDENTCVSNVLLIRHLPGLLPIEDQVELIKHFGATDVKCVGKKGPLKYCAFAKFNDQKEAQEALKRLHQFHVLGHTITAEYSRKSFEEITGEKVTDRIKGYDEKQPEQAGTPDRLKIQDTLDSISQTWSLRYPFNPKLRYVYPPPSPSILANISNALIAVPRFYVQVLHLMNKMNLPAPFGILTPAPPLPQEHLVDVPPPQEPEEGEVETVEMEVESTEESELETDSGGENQVAKRTATTLPKRRKTVKLQKPKKPRLLATNITTLPKTPAPPSMKPTEVFEQPTSLPAKKIEIKFGPEVVQESVSISVDHKAVETTQWQKVELPKTDDTIDHTDSNALTVVEGGFGKIEPVALKDNVEEGDSSSEDEELGSGDFISSRSLRRGRLTARDMRDMNVFRNYEPGEPTTRLYIKNLAKQTVEKDLHYIFGKYVNWDNESEKNMFDIRLMKEGRMKGQCFVTLASERKAKQAREDTNGYQLKGKPMVVQFARSAKPKEGK